MNGRIGESHHLRIFGAAKLSVAALLALTSVPLAAATCGIDVPCSCSLVSGPHAGTSIPLLNSGMPIGGICTDGFGVGVVVQTGQNHFVAPTNPAEDSPPTFTNAPPIPLPGASQPSDEDTTREAIKEERTAESKAEAEAEAEDKSNNISGNTLEDSAESPSRSSSHDPAVSPPSVSAHDSDEVSVITGTNMGAREDRKLNCNGSCVPEYVMFTTDRIDTEKSNPNERFASGRNDGGLRYGTCLVTIPTKHRRGVVERPSIFRLEFHEDPTKHIVLAGIQVQSYEKFLNRLNSQLDSTEKDALLFVHGYNVSFAEAARRTAQVAYDLHFRGAGSRGVAVFYSWPSQGHLIPYSADEANAEWTEGHLESFLEDFLRNSKASHVYLMAHSMGSRPLLRAIREIAVSQPALLARVNQLILAAPDFDADTFENQIAPAIEKAHVPGTLYVSGRDLALKASERLHGDFPRLGDVSAGPVLVQNIDTIDVSQVDTGDFLGHAYFASKLLQDLFDVFGGISVKERFGLEPVHFARGDYWRYSR